jgi:hypothetical protein
VIGEACGGYFTGRNEEKLIFLWASPYTFAFGGVGWKRGNPRRSLYKYEGFLDKI